MSNINTNSLDIASIYKEVRKNRKITGQVKDTLVEHAKRLESEIVKKTKLRR